MIGWTPQLVAIVVSWLFMALLYVMMRYCVFLPFRPRRFLSYLVAILAFACLVQWRGEADHLWNFDLISAEILIANIVIVRMLETWYIRVETGLGRALRRDAFVLGALFLISQAWLVWDGGRIEFYMMLAARAALLVTGNLVITELLDPPDYKIVRTRGER